MSPSVEPFDKAKYKALMDGLECNEVLKSSVALNTLDFRLDTSLFIKSIVEKEKVIKSLDHFFLKKNEVFTGPFGSTLTAPSHMESGFIPLVRSININQGFYINRNDLVFITEEDNEKIKHSQLFEDDIVLSRVGSIGYFARVDSLLKTCNISSNNIGIRLGNYERPIKHYILTFLNTRTANQLVVRLATGNVQPKLTTKDMCLIPIPAFSSEYYTFISKFVDKSEDAIVQAEDNYKEAERILAIAMNIRGINQVLPVKAEKHLSDSFGKTGRLDAEYYQPKYESIEQKLNTSETVLSLCNLYDKNFVPQDKESYQYIELADVGQSGDISGVDIQYGSDLPTRARRVVKSGQIIVSSVEGSLQSCALITDEYDEALCSTGFYVLDSNCINSETLLVLFKSEPIQALMKQRCSGTILAAISKDELLSMPLPMIDADTQKVIATKVQESFALRKQSRQLLEYAKQAVEMAIEQGEDAALVWLKDKVS